MLPFVSEDPTERRAGLYDTGKTTLYACKADPRFSYGLYVPPDMATREDQPNLIVSVHGTLRKQTSYRDAFSEFGRYNNCVVLAPLFPVGVRGDDAADGYKYLLEGEIRYDLVLLEMVEEVERRLRRAFPKFMMFGFSGGGHFTHRFLYLHPERLKAVSIGAPGSVTLLDDTKDWWVGIRDVREKFGKDINFTALGNVKAHCVVGHADRETWEITHKPGGPHYMEGANDAGSNRIERAQSLIASLSEHGMDTRLDLAPGISHSMSGIVPFAQDFFLDVLRTESRGAS
ncbi:alpha/beta hydrolase [Roseibium sp. SCP14]|uniref:alpha/beta hydrolase n=1 Tax=Roseibium sp. SCP14 TaxID=3141375 RepID=UPI0033382048